MKILRRFIKKNPTTLNIPFYSIGGSIDRINFILNSLLLFFVFTITVIQNVSSVPGVFGKIVIVFIAIVFQVNNVFKRFRDITGRELSFSDKAFFVFLILTPLLNILGCIYLSYKIGYLEIIKRRNELLREMT